MTRTPAMGRAKLRKPLAVIAVFSIAAFLAGCSNVDDMLFGGSDSENAENAPGSLPSNSYPAPAGNAGALVPESSGITAQRIPIEQGASTGTAVGMKVQELRTTLLGLQDHVEANAQRLSGLRQAEAGNAAIYNQAKATINSRLQIGTTRGNPELVAQWNTAQAALDRIAADINTYNSLGTDITADDSQAHFSLDTIRATYAVSGAVDEDHRQLNVLEDETSQTVVVIERLLTQVSHDIQRETSYVANERANLTILANAIKNGEIYGAALSPSMADMGPAPMRNNSAAMAASGTPLVVIKFDRANVDYQQILYTALAQALERRPDAGFEVVAVAPTAGTASAVQLAQTQTQRNAQSVMRSITDMGVPANRLALSSTTDPTVSTGEVRVYIR